MNKGSKIITLFIVIVCVGLSILFVLSFLTACQKTPEEPIIVGKNQEAMIEKATAEDSENQPLAELKEEADSEQYTATLVNEKGDLTVEVDAEITYPKVDGIPVGEVIPGEIPKDIARALIRELLQGEKLYEHKNKEETSEILEYIQWLEDVKNGKTEAPEYKYLEDEESIQSNIEFWQERIPTSVESNAGKEVDIESLEPQTNHSRYYAVIDGDRTSVSYEFSGEGDPYWKLTFGRYDGIYSDNGVPLLHRQELGIYSRPEGPEREYAIQTADALLNKVGITNMCCVRSEYGRFDTMNYDPNRSDLGWKLEYKTCVNGVPVILDTGGGSEDGDDVAKPWGSERMWIYVSDEGIVGFDWQYPYGITGTISDDAKLLSVDEIKSIFEKMILIENNWVNKNGDEKNSLKIKIDSIELGLTRIMKQNEHDKALLVPSWIFTGRKYYKGTAGGITDDREAQLIINAIDGSIIDIAKGY